MFLISANVGFPNEEICKGIFDEIIFTELQRDEAQELMEGYNKVLYVQESWPLLYSKLLYKMGPYFLDIH